MPVFTVTIVILLLLLIVTDKKKDPIPTSEMGNISPLPPKKHMTGVPTVARQTKNRT